LIIKLLLIISFNDIKRITKFSEEKNQGYGTINGLVNHLSKLISSVDEKSLGYFSLLNTTQHAMVHKLTKGSVEKYQPDITINIPRDTASTFDFHKADELILNII